MSFVQNPTLFWTYSQLKRNLRWVDYLKWIVLIRISWFIILIKKYLFLNYAILIKKFLMWVNFELCDILSFFTETIFTQIFLINWLIKISKN